MEYRLNAGQYVLHANSPMGGDLEPVGRVLDQVSLAIDKAEGILHKHGIPDRVSAWHANASKKLRDGGLGEWADNLVVVTGRFPLEEVNKCLSCMNYAGNFYKRLLAGEIEELPFVDATEEQDSPRPSIGG
jgi:hypothetical protein